jgi:hypothetical protein
MGHRTSFSALLVLAVVGCAGDEKPGKQVEAKWYCQQAEKVSDLCAYEEEIFIIPILENEREQWSRQIYQITYDYTNGYNRGHYVDIDTGDVFCYWHEDYPELPAFIFDTNWKPGECASDHTDKCGCPPE